MTSNSICLAFRAASYFSTKKNSRREISAGRASWRSARIMTQLVRALPPNTLDDDAWDDLLSFIEERRVIPIVGPELLQVATPSGPKLLYDWLAERLAAKLSVDVTELPQPYTLNDVVPVPRHPRAARGSLCPTAKHPAGCQPRAVGKSATSGREHRFRSVRLHHFRSAAGDGHQSRAIRRLCVHGCGQLCAQSRGGSAGGTRPAAAAAGLPPVRSRLRLADLRDLRRGPARIHLRAPERTPGA